MTKADEKRISAMRAKTLAMMCVRNTGLETLHAGIVPVTHARDYSGEDIAFLQKLAEKD